MMTTTNERTNNQVKDLKEVLKTGDIKFHLENKGDLPIKVGSLIRSDGDDSEMFEVAAIDGNSMWVRIREVSTRIFTTQFEYKHAV